MVTQVMMCKPNWEKGYIDKHLITDLQLEEICPILPMDAELMSHIQLATTGCHLIRVRHYLDSNKVDLSVHLITSPKPLTIKKKLPMSEKVKSFVEAMLVPENKLFSMFRGIDMSHQENFDADVDLVKGVILPLALVDKEMYDFIIEELAFSKASDLPTVTSSKKPKWLNARERLITDEEGYSIQHVSEHWLLFYPDGKVEFPTLKPTKGAHIKHKTQRLVETYTNPPEPMPDAVVKAVKITIGVTPVNEQMRGIAWKIYHR